MKTLLLVFTVMTFHVFGQDGVTMIELDTTFTKEIKSQHFKGQFLYGVTTTEPVASLELILYVYKYDESGNPIHDTPVIKESYEVIKYQKGKNPKDGIEYAIVDAVEKNGVITTYQFIYDFDKGYSIIVTQGKSNPTIIKGDIIF